MTRTTMTMTGAPVGGEVISFKMNGVGVEHVFRTGETIEEAMLALHQRVLATVLGKVPYSFGPAPENPQAFLFTSAWDGWPILVTDLSTTGSLKAVLTYS